MRSRGETRFIDIHSRRVRNETDQFGPKKSDKGKRKEKGESKKKEDVASHRSDKGEKKAAISFEK